MDNKVIKRRKFTEEEKEYLLKNKNLPLDVLSANEFGISKKQIKKFFSNRKIKIIGTKNIKKIGNPYDLTEKEREILPYLFLKKQEIANIFVLSETTIKTHVTHIYQKLFSHNPSQAILKAIQKGIITAEEILEIMEKQEVAING